MKKAIFVFLLTCIAMLGFTQTALIKELAGTVELKLSGASDFIPAGVGVEVAQDTIISTGFKSTALVQAGSAVITVRPLTRLTLTEIQASQGAETLNMNLQSGRVRVEVNLPAGSKATLEIASPAAVASVRGTSFDFDARNLRVDSGTVLFMGKWGYEVSVHEGQISVVGASGTATFITSQPGIIYDKTAAPTGGTGIAKSGSSGGGTIVGGGGGGGGGSTRPPTQPTRPPVTNPGGSDNGYRW
jgi:uncharacterized membrane protein YgcG